MIEAAKLPTDTNHIHLKGVKQNNLKNIDVSFPLGNFTVVTGLSGTGKSSLVFETLHAEGQRRYVETFSAYTRQFLDLLDKPDVDSVENIRPSIAIEQSNTVKTSRSTVGTMTELCDYFKVWFNHQCKCYDPETGELIEDEHPQIIWGRLFSEFASQTALVCFDIPKPENISWEEILQNLQAQGYARTRSQAGEILRLESLKPEALNDDEPLTIIQDRIKIVAENRPRFLESLETAQHFGSGKVTVYDDKGLLGSFSRGLHSSKTGKTFQDKSAALFSFNSPLGACPKCRGFGRVIEIDYRLVIPDENLSIKGGAIKAFTGDVYRESLHDLLDACQQKGIDPSVPWREMSKKDRTFVMDGEPGYKMGDFDRKGSWYGVKRFFGFLESTTYKMHVRVFLSKYRSYVECPACGGTRFQPESLYWKWEDYRLPDLYRLPVEELEALVREKSEPVGNPQVDTAREAILNRLHYLNEVGLGYLSLDRSSRSLSGGEVERVNLTACLGTQLTDTLFVLDEPSVGLHSRDIDRLVNILRKLTDLGNTVVVVEHDEAVMAAADHIIEMGPKPGNAGGQVIFEGPVNELLIHPNSLTGRYLSGRMELEIETHKRRSVGLQNFPLDGTRKRKSSKQAYIEVKSATIHNIEDLSCTIPLNRLVCMTGVSGSGKSTLLNQVIYQGLMQASGRAVEHVAQMKSISIDGDWEVLFVDQSAVSRTPRSNPALFVDAWEHVRKLFAATEQAISMGFTHSDFSFNSGQGRCEHCSGLGYEKVEMQFLSDVFVKCPVCDGKRFKPEILEVKLQELSISDILEMDIEAAVAFFADYPKVIERLTPLIDVGLGYLTMGQPLNTLSGGESQRLKLVRYFHQIGDGDRKALLLLDEPTTGLHRHDVKVLLDVFQKLIGLGHSLVVIEHHMDVIQSADWVIELGPEAGKAGGRLVAAGAPEYVASLDTVTAPFLRQALEGNRMEPLEVAEEQSDYQRSPMMPTLSDQGLEIRGAREHNLKNFDIRIPSRAISVVTGVSGSGKSSLAFDIIFAEGQRRFMESMSSYARQFVEQLPKPNIDDLRGIAPTVAIEQRVTRGSRKSTVATITEVAQYLRLLYARLGVQHSPKTGKPVVAEPKSVVYARAKQSIKDWLKSPGKSNRLYLCASVIRGRKGHHQPLADWALSKGYPYMRCDGKLVKTEAFEKLDRYREHDVEIIIRELPLKSEPQPQKAFQESIQEADKLGKGSFFLMDNRDRILATFSTSRIDPDTGFAYPELDPKHFSINSPKGWCPSCRGYGRIYHWIFEDGPPSWAKNIKDGSVCPHCNGDRLNEISRAVKLIFKDGSRLSLPELLSLTPEELLEKLSMLELDARGEAIMTDILPQIVERLDYMGEVGIEYLSLNRETQSLSGGEAQRIRLASQLGTNLTGVLYVLDEPSIGLHPADNERLIDSLKHLREKGNTLVVVEHDDETMRNADHIIDLGPGAGKFGGEITAQGPVHEVLDNENSLTGKYLKEGIAHPLQGKYRELPKPYNPRSKKQHPDWLVLKSANLRNLKGDDLHLPLGKLVMVCGVSGAGKSTLVRDLLIPSLDLAIKDNAPKISRKECEAAGLFVEDYDAERKKAYPLKELVNGHAFNKVIEVDQSPIGKTPRSNPCTYIGIFDTIRQLFASTPEAKMKGYNASTFSFNTAKGRCENCKGAGRIKLEMSFMPDTYVDCDVCKGTRYQPEIQQIEWNGKSIVDVLNMSFEEAIEYFDFHSSLKDVMQLMVDTGLGYLTLGQSSPSLSGGEAQRVKLVSELTKGLQSYKDKSRGIQNRNLYVLEEPTIGLHLSDCEKLIVLLHKLVNQGHTVVVIEHHLDLIAEADYLVEVGPGSGNEGGQILYQGDLEGILEVEGSPTAPFLKTLLKLK